MPQEQKGRKRKKRCLEEQVILVQASKRTSLSSLAINHFFKDICTNLDACTSPAFFFFLPSNYLFTPICSKKKSYLFTLFGSSYPLNIFVPFHLSMKISCHRSFMGLPHSALCICASFSSYGCWSTVSISAVFWIWFGLERSYNTDMVRSAWSCCPVTFTVS